MIDQELSFVHEVAIKEYQLKERVARLVFDRHTDNAVEPLIDVPINNLFGSRGYLDISIIGTRWTPIYKRWLLGNEEPASPWIRQGVPGSSPRMMQEPVSPKPVVVTNVQPDDDTESYNVYADEPTRGSSPSIEYHYSDCDDDYENGDNNEDEEDYVYED